MYCEVLSSWRRQGIGKKMLARVHDLMRAHSKTLLTVSADEPDGHGFLQHIGASEKSTSTQSRLAMDQAPWEVISDWESVALAARPGANMITYATRIPEDQLPTLLPIMSSLMADMPLDDLDLPPIVLTVEEHVEWCSQLERLGGASPIIFLRDADNSICGVTATAWPSRSESEAMTYMTAVRRDLRGCGIAKGLKAAMLRHLKQYHPTITHVGTFNAKSNSAMLHINKALGFTAVHHLSTYQIDLDAIGAYLHAD